ncbi:MAG: hypothetical protein JKX67_10990 [Colwellia sp.]|nr:hypothetical protein [Colwellia sp.]
MLEKLKSKLSRHSKNKGKHFHFKATSPLTGFLFLLLSQVTNATSQSLASITLSDVLDATLSTQKSKNINRTPFTKNNQTITWLASSPKLGVNYFKSDQGQGTDELEVSLSLPFKSTLQTQVDDDLIRSNKTLQSLFSLNQKLFFSGLIRTQLWNIKIATTQASNIDRKLSFLARLEKQYQQLVKSSEVTKYSLLLIQQEVLDAQIARLSHNENLNGLMLQYQLLTGLNYLPLYIFEEKIITDKLLMTAHPQIQKLDQEWFEFERNLQLSTNKSEPWSLSFSAKRLDNNTLNETQVGVGIEVPLTFFAIEKQSLSNKWQQEKNNYDLARSAQLMALQQRFQGLLSQQSSLTQKQTLLEQSKHLSKAIISETQLLLDAHQIERGQALRRMLNAFNTKSQLNLNQLFLLKNIVMLRQSAGISL